MKRLDRLTHLLLSQLHRRCRSWYTKEKTRPHSMPASVHARQRHNMNAPLHRHAPRTGDRLFVKAHRSQVSSPATSAPPPGKPAPPPTLRFARKPLLIAMPVNVAVLPAGTLRTCVEPPASRMHSDAAPVVGSTTELHWMLAVPTGVDSGPPLMATVVLHARKAQRMRWQ